MKKLRLSSPPEHNYVHWDEETFERLRSSDPEALDSRFDIDHSTLLYLLQRPGGAHRGYHDLLGLIDLSHERDARKAILRRKARMVFRSLRHAGIVDVLPADREADLPAQVVLADSLQHDFSVHHGLSLFLVEIAQGLDLEHADAHLTLLTFVEAILEDPGVVLRRQQDKERDKEYQRLKAEGAEYEELREKLDKVTWPQPDADLVRQSFEAFARQHPWVAGFEPRPKSVARDMYERWASFNQYVKEYGLERSEGVLLRYLNQTYKALRQNVPNAYKSERVHEVIAYLRQIIARADSSLLDEWRALRDGPDAVIEEEVEQPLDSDPLAFRARVHAELMQIVAALASQDYLEVSILLRPAQEPWSAEDLEEAMLPFYEAYDRIVFNHEARSRKLARFDRQGPGLWRVTQVLLDDAGDNMWYLEGTVDLSAIDPENDRLFALDYLGE